MKLELPWATDIRGQSFAILAPLQRWPRYHGLAPEAAVRERGGLIRDGLLADLDYAVFGNGRQKGKADAERKAAKLLDKGARFQLLDEDAFVYLMRPQLEGASFHFAGELDFGRGAANTAPDALVKTLGGMVLAKVDEALDFLVVGDRRGKGKAAALTAAERIRASGASLRIIDEAAFLELLGAVAGAPAESEGEPAGSPLAQLLVALPGITDAPRIKRALDMLRTESMQLYADVSESHVAGIVRSQTGYSDYYSTRLSSEGKFSCCDSSLDWCMGMQGGVCKHLLVLLLGLVQSGQLPVANARSWLSAAKQPKSRRPAGTENIRDQLADTLLRYKAAEAGELDWRPTETVPEDFYAF